MSVCTDKDVPHLPLGELYFSFWSHFIGCSEGEPILLPQKVSLRVVRKEIRNLFIYLFNSIFIQGHPI